MITSGKKYIITKLDRKNKHWSGVEKALKRRTKNGLKTVRMLELYEVRWRDKPFKFKFSDFDKNKRWFYHGTSLSNINAILNQGFQVGAARNGRMLGDGIYATYHTHKGVSYGVDNYIFSVMVYAPKTYVVDRKKNIDGTFINSAKGNFDAVEVRTDSVVKGYTMQNHEICVYDTTRIQPRFIIKIG